jgi:hypothetical protein
MSTSRPSFKARSLAAVGICAVTVALATSPASAESTTVAPPVRTTVAPPVRTTVAGRPAVDSAATKVRCTAAIKARLVAIDRLTARVRVARELTDAHRRAINAYLTSARSGLEALATAIAADTDPVALEVHCAAIVTEYRIFALRVPQTHLVIVADAESAILTRMTRVAASLAAAIERAGNAGKDTAIAEEALGQLNAKLTEASAELEGVADKVVAVQPSDWNADNTILSGPSAAVRSARADLAA